MFNRKHTTDEHSCEQLASTDSVVIDPTPSAPDAVAEFIAKVDTLDIMAFVGADFVSDTITDLEQWQTGNGEISHVGVAISNEWLPLIHTDAPPGTMFVWESTMSGRLNDGVNDAETGGSTFGLQFRRLDDVLRAYSTGKARVGVCKLTENPTHALPGEAPEDTEERHKKLCKALAKAYKKYHKRGYNYNALDLVSSLFPPLRPVRNVVDAAIERVTNKHLLFCSEFAARLYRDLGILSKDVDTRDVVPVDFLGADADKQIPCTLCQPLQWFVAATQQLGSKVE